MTTRLALALFIVIILAIGVDTRVLDTGITLSLLRRGIDLLQTLAFWR